MLYSGSRLIVRHIWKATGTATWIRTVPSVTRNPKFIDLPFIPQVFEEFTRSASILDSRDEEVADVLENIIDINGFSLSIQLKEEIGNKPFDVEAEALEYENGKYSENDLVNLFTKVLKAENSEFAVKLFTILSKNPNNSLESLATAWTIATLKFRPNAYEALNSWKNIASVTLSKAGTSYLLEYILKDEKYDKAVLKQMLNVCKDLQTPSETIAQIISTLVKLKKTEQARMIFSRVFIDGSHFKKPLEKLVKEADLETIEELANLFANYCSAELKRRKNLPEKEKELNDVNTIILLQEVHSFIGISLITNLPNRSRGKLKPKKNKVNQHYLFYLLNFTRDAWLKLARNDSSTERCKKWCEIVCIDEGPMKNHNNK